MWSKIGRSSRGDILPIYPPLLLVINRQLATMLPLPSGKSLDS